MWGSSVSQEQLQRSIQILRKLSEVPEQSSENILVSKSTWHQLAISQECEIASSFAFLSATSDAGSKVMAACIEESYGGKELTVRVAMNTGEISTPVNGLETLARALEQAARRQNSKEDDKRYVFQKVVGFDLFRILSRLRSRHAKTKKAAGKMALITQLSQALEDPLAIYPTILREAKSRVQNLQSLFASLESIPGLSNTSIDEAQDLVGKLVYQIHEFNNAINLRELLRNRSLDPSLKAHIPRAMDKIGQYYSASSILVSAARNSAWQIFQKVQVVPCQIQAPTASQVARNKVHAEIQLLFFYELHPQLPRPRFICSSKSACYLCNLFFLTHGGFQVPRSHGRLYDLWVLPGWLAIPEERYKSLGDVVSSFKRRIDDKVKLMKRSNNRRYEHPNESTLLPFSHWSSSSAFSITQCPRTHLTTPVASGCRSAQSIMQRTPSLTAALPRTPQKDYCKTPNLDRSNHGSQGSLAIAKMDAIKSRSFDHDIIYIGFEKLPYHKAISMTTPSLHLKIRGCNISLTVEFAKVLSGHLTITTVGACKTEKMDFSLVQVEHIPTATELRIDPPQASNKLKIMLRYSQGYSICLEFEWHEQLQIAVP